MALDGSVGRGTSCIVTSSSFEATDVVVVGTQQALFGAGPKGEGAHWPSTLGEGAPEGEGTDSLASWILTDMRLTNQFTGVPTIANTSSWSPSHSRWAPYLLSSAASLNFLWVCKEKKGN